MSDLAAGPVERHGFSATGAAFEGFVIARREPRTVLAWTALMMVFTLAGVGLMFALLGSSMGALTPTPGAPADPARVVDFFVRAIPLYAVFTLASLALYAVMYAAVNRTVLRPGAGGFGHLRLGVDEVRQAGLLLAIWIGLLVVYAIGFVALIAAVRGLAAVSAPLGVLLGVVGAIGALFGALFLLVRLSLLSPLAFDRGRIDVGAAWRLTVGRFWPLLGAYVLAAVVCFVMFVAASTLAAAIGFAMTVGSLAGGGDPGRAVGAVWVVQVINVVLTSATYGVAFALMLGAPARAYADIMRPARAVEVFGPSPVVAT